MKEPITIELDDLSRKALDVLIDTALRAAGSRVLPPIDHLRAVIARAEAASTSNVASIRHEDTTHG